MKREKTNNRHFFVNIYKRKTLYKWKREFAGLVGVKMAGAGGAPKARERGFSAPSAVH
jgi:hypothetical protein